MSRITRYRWFGLVAGWLALGVVALPAQVSLVPTGSVWRFFDQGAAPSGWTGASFNDRAWLSGPATFSLPGGFPVPDAATQLSRINPAGETNATFYFRRTFTVANPAAFSNLLLRVGRDDGVVVHLNGQEAWRDNLPPGPVVQATLASAPASDDGLLYHAAFLPVSRLLAGTNLLAIEIHQASLDSLDMRFDLELAANLAAAGPTLQWVQPTPGDVLGTSRIPLCTSVSAGSSPITRVEFLADGNLVGATQEPSNLLFGITWTNAAPGRHLLQATALDATGLSTTSAPVVIDVLPSLVPRGALWKYLDDGSDLSGSPWRAADFDDSSWPAGPAQLGFGDGDEATLVRSGPPEASFITTYFRHAFIIANPAAVTNLVLRILRDDGVIAHLNGVEVYRNNMPEGPVTANTHSLMAVDDPTFHAARIPPGLLVTGRNLLAIEVHQSGPSSSDLSLDAELLPNVMPQAPRVALRSPADQASLLGPIQIAAEAATWDPDDSVVSVALYTGNTLLGTAVPDAEGVARPTVLLATGNHLLRAVATDSSGLRATSAPVTVQVIAAPVVTTLVPTGSVWRYLDTATGPGAGWSEVGFNDSGWKSGAGILGYGGLGPANANPGTIIDGGPVGGRYLTAYFRRHFTATGVAYVTNLAFRVVRDDGVVVYLNGLELFRMNMPTGPVTATTPANVNVSGTNELFYAPIQIPIPNGLLREGDNVLAVEMHQDSVNTSDAAFDLGLISVASPQAPLRLALRLEPTAMVLSWTGSGAILQRASGPQGPYTDVPGAANPLSFPLTSSPAFFRLRQAP